MRRKELSRRGFLTKSAAVTAGVGTFMIVPRHVLGGPGYKAPSDTITRGVIGVGGRGRSGFHLVTNKPGSPPVTLAVCDLDENNLARGLKQAGEGCTPYKDFRDVLDRKDIDTVHVVTPPHWHAIVSCAAAQAGMDVLCEKPLTRTIAEGQIVADTMRKHGRILQIGTFFRFGNYYRYGQARNLKKLVESGKLGWPLTVRITKKQGFNWKVARWSGRTDLTPETPPKTLDWDMYLGPAPYKPYHPHRCHHSFRGYWDYDNGGLGDMGQHYVDPVTYILGKDDEFPVEIESKAPWPQHPDAVGLWERVDFKYADGTKIIFHSGEWGEAEEDGHAFIEGPKGKVFNGPRTEPEGLFEDIASLPDPPKLINFDEAVRTRQQPGGPADSSHRSNSLMLLAGISIRMGRKLHFDPKMQRFIGDDEANRLIDIPMRAPWSL